MQHLSHQFPKPLDLKLFCMKLQQHSYSTCSVKLSQSLLSTDRGRTVGINELKDRVDNINLKGLTGQGFGFRFGLIMAG